MEGRPKGKTEGQLGPYGSRRGPNSTAPHRAPGKAEEGGTVLPLQSSRPHVQGVPQKNQQTPSLHQGPSSYHPTNWHHRYRGSNHLPNGDRRRESQPPSGGTKRPKQRHPGQSPERS